MFGQVRALNHLLSLYRSREEKQGYERWLRKQFTAADMDKNKCLSFPETLRLLKQLNIEMDESDVKKLFREANVRKSKPGTPEVLDEDEFIKMYFALLKRPDFENLYDRLVIHSNLLCFITILLFQSILIVRKMDASFSFQRMLTTRHFYGIIEVLMN